MKKKTMFSVISVVVISAGVWLFVTDAESEGAGQFSRETVSVSSTSSSLARASSSSQASASSANAQQGQVEPVEVKEEWPSEVGESFESAARAYAEEIKSPSYSRPLTAADIQLLTPNAYFPQTIPLEDGGSASIQLAQYRFLFPEPVVVRLNVEGMSISDPTVKLFSADNNELLATKMNAITANNFESSLTGKANWNGQLKIEVKFSSKSKTQVLQTEFEYHQPVAHITGMGDVRVDGADLVIPVLLNIEKSGMYRLTANLLTEAKAPIALLTQSEKLSAGKNVLELRAHKSVLDGYSGPFWLGTLQLELRSAAPGQMSQYGTSSAPEFLIPAVDLSVLADEAYLPSDQELQRLEFLNQMKSPS